MEWDFVAEFDEEHVLSGDGFGGHLRRIDTTSGKAWQASLSAKRHAERRPYGEGIKGEPRLTREISKYSTCSPKVYDSYIKHKVEYRGTRDGIQNAVANLAKRTFASFFRLGHV